MPFLSECIARFFFLLFYGLVSVCGADGCARARHKTSVDDGKNTLKFVSFAFFFGGREREKKETLFHSYIYGLIRKVVSKNFLLSSSQAHDAPPFEDESDDNRRRCKKKKKKK